MPNKRTAVRSSASIVMMNATITRDGVTHQIAPVNYQRVEYTDGRVEESGRPQGLPANATLGDVLRAAFTSSATCTVRRVTSTAGASKSNRRRQR